jgi:hypothetical protein
MFRNNKMPTRPLASMVAACCAGNWYKTAGHHYMEMIGNMSDMCWNMHVRGGRIEVCRRIAIYVLDNCYKAYDGEGRSKRLEWWKYRNGVNKKGHPLWGGCDYIEMPEIYAVENPKMLRVMPDNACQDWLNYHGNKIKFLEPGMLGGYKNDLIYEAHSSLFKTHMERQRVHNAFSMGEGRENNGHVKGDVCANFDENYMLKKMVSSEMARRPSTIEKTLAALSLDIKLFQIIGGWNAVAKALGKDKYKYCNRELEIKKPVEVLAWNNAMWRLDPAVRTVIMNRELSS